MSLDKFRKLMLKEYIMLDGAMGTMLQKNGLKPGFIPELLNITHRELPVSIHKSYIQSGSDIICANTFGANRFKTGGPGFTPEYTLEKIISAAIENVCIARAEEKSECLAALDIGPLGKLMEPSGELTFNEAYDSFKEIVIYGKNAGADLIIIETMTDLLEAKAALLAAKENSGLPVICTMSFDENMRTFTGTHISSAALTLEGLGADAIGINCSLGPDKIYPIIKELIKYTSLPVAVKPNAGLPDPVTNQYNIFPEEFAEYMVRFINLGVKFYGGCCGSTPEYILRLSEKLSSGISAKSCQTDLSPLSASPCICSSRKTVRIDMPRIIGERINPTGKKLFKEALRSGDINYIVDQALEQVSAGAEILDVNVGLPEINEKEMMVTVIKELQGAVDVPLQIDSTDPEVLEAALRIYSGKPIVNSVNGEEESMSKVLPLVKKYGAAVVCLTLDERGIPVTAEQRLEIARKIMDRAVSMGIPKKDIFIDCLTLTASAQQEGVMETLNAVKMVREELGLKTVLGVSNISFGLPEREMINQSFLTMALTYGLDMPIINPNIGAMTGTVHAYRVLANIDKNSVGYISKYAGTEEKDNIQAAGRENRNDINYDRKNSGNRLIYAIENGLADEGAKITGEMLEITDSLEIIDNYLIPALDRTGQKYESGKIFLPQLIMSANAAQACFSVIKEKLSADPQSMGVSKGRIILATVKGDIHDIGKNIVKILLENYGYEVIDLGKDVDPQIIADTAAEEGVTLVGLSALMTTTLKAMEETTAILRRQGNCSVMVGGAVLTPEYAARIGADYYAKDAKDAVDIARKHFN